MTADEMAAAAVAYVKTAVASMLNSVGILNQAISGENASRRTEGFALDVRPCHGCGITLINGDHLKKFFPFELRKEPHLVIPLQ